MLYLTLRHYEYVAGVAQHGGLTAAAEALHVSQPALSTALARIEEHLGHPLFLRRRGAALILTPQGRDFAARAQTLLEQAALLENPRLPPKSAQPLCFGCFSDLAPFLLAPTLRTLRAALPGHRIDFRADPFDPLISALGKSEIDLAISYDLGLDASFNRTELCRLTPHALVTPDHPVSAQASVTLAELAQFPLTLSHEGLSVQHMLSLFKAQGLMPKIAHRAASLELLRSLAANGEGIGISYSLPPGSLSYDGKLLKAIPISDPEAREPIVLISHGQMPKDSPLGVALSALSKELPKYLASR
ncbi:LysR family transcriptional regulator [Parasedimentitalea maritima]|uniref:LysR family transcriptional regulator n=1 Tax=Parasedimentitalea maritima TaxID=2578117 RepID=A0A6A4RM46_9RHOB|nr:LysR family transcriptional regulator [Zongyanglinia marina]KAE9632798.1 LysR family transcriptional regulator [Zongyanglinia marina]